MEPLVVVLQNGWIIERPGIFNLAAALVVFSITAILGFGAGAYFHDAQNIRNLIAFVITMVWVVSNLAQIAVPGYQSSIYIHGLMGATTGYLFGINSPVQKALSATVEALNATDGANRHGDREK